MVSVLDGPQFTPGSLSAILPEPPAGPTDEIEQLKGYLAIKDRQIDSLIEQCKARGLHIAQLQRRLHKRNQSLKRLYSAIKDNIREIDMDEVAPGE